MSTQYMHLNIDPLILSDIKKITTGADPEIFQRGGWGGNFWKKNVCWYTYQRVYTLKLDFLSSSFSRGFLYFFALFYYSLLFLKFATPVTPPPPLDPPMHKLGIKVKLLHVTANLYRNAVCRDWFNFVQMKEHTLFQLEIIAK